MMTRRPTIDVVTVCYNSNGALEKYYKTRGSEELTVTFINNSLDDAPIVAANTANAQLVQSPQNIGFGRGCNEGARRGEGKWIAFLNPDVSITKLQLIEIVSNAPADAVAISPLLVNADNQVLSDVIRKTPTVAGIARKWILGKLEDQELPDQRSTRHLPVEVTSGACLIIRRDAFELAGGFPEWIFLNSEDVFLCRELTKFGQIYVDTSVTALHQKLSSADVVPIAGIMAETARSASLYAAVVFEPWPKALVAWMSVLLGYALRSAMRPQLRQHTPRLIRTAVHEARLARAGHLGPVGPIFLGSP